MPDSPPDNVPRQGVFASLLAELRRRRVNHVAGLYLMGALGVIGYGGDILDNLGAPAAAARWLTLLTIAGFPVVVAASWAYDLRLHRERGAAASSPYASGLRGAVILASGILIGMGLLGVVAFWSRDGSAAPAAGPSAVPVVGVLPIRSEGGEPAAWLSSVLESSVTPALSQSRGVTMRSRDVVGSYAMLPPDSLARLLRMDYLVTAEVLVSAGESRLTVQVLDTAGTVVGRAATLTAGPPSVVTAEELTQRIRDHVLHTLGAEVRTARWRFGTRSDRAFNLLYQADRLVTDARSLMDREGGARAAGRVLDDADALLLESTAADPHWTAPPLLRARIANLRAYALVLHDAPPALIEAALDSGIAIASRLLEREPENAQALAARGLLRYRKVVFLDDLAPASREQRLIEAERDLRAGLRLDGTMTESAAELSALLYNERGDFADASFWAERALELDAYQANADGITHRLAMATFALGRDAEALRLCHDAVQRFGSSYHQGCVIEVLAFGDVHPDVRDAWSHLENLRRDPLVAPRTVAFYEAQVAAVLARANQRDSALRVLERALERVRTRHAAEPDAPGLLCLEAAVRFRLRQLDTATTLLRACAARGTAASAGMLDRPALKPYRHLLEAARGAG